MEYWRRSSAPSQRLNCGKHVAETATVARLPPHSVASLRLCENSVSSSAHAKAQRRQTTSDGREHRRLHGWIEDGTGPPSDPAARFSRIARAFCPFRQLLFQDTQVFLIGMDGLFEERCGHTRLLQFLELLKRQDRPETAIDQGRHLEPFTRAGLFNAQRPLPQCGRS